MDSLYEQALELNVKKLMELEEEYYRKHSSDKEPFKEVVPRIFRMEDSYFKFVIKGEKVLKSVSYELVKLFFNCADCFEIFHEGGNEISVEKGKRRYSMDMFSQSDNIDIDIEMQTFSYRIERFFIYWAAGVATRDNGIPTDKLRMKQRLLVIISNAGQPLDVTASTEKWYFGTGSFPFDTDNGKIIGKLIPTGLNTLVIDLEKFKKQVKKPRLLLDYYLSFLLTSTYQEMRDLCNADEDGIMREIILRDMEFLSRDDTWRGYMEYHNKFFESLAEKYANEYREKIEAELEARIRAEQEARIQALKLVYDEEIRTRDEEIRKLRISESEYRARAERTERAEARVLEFTKGTQKS
ncbi:hypothetical protein [Succinimonas amylolytica]|uniref:hypothetical protein n=1 Tax=Succinimonas amylolytica TaxID=83769 RepID=UPI0003770602|nr:hypothetical protein [Succinimonas amylolytica]